MNLSEYKDIIKQAIANEVEARKFYDDAAKTLKDPHLKTLFASLAEEEKKHRDILTMSTTSTNSNAGIVRSVLKRIWMMTSVRRWTTARKPTAIPARGMINFIKSNSIHP